MNISLSHSEIEVALRHYVETLGMDLTNKNIEVNMTAGRGGNGYKAEISIEPTITESIPSAPITRTKETPVTTEVKEKEETPPTEAQSLFS